MTTKMGSGNDDIRITYRRFRRDGAYRINYLIAPFLQSAGFIEFLRNKRILVRRIVIECVNVINEWIAASDNAIFFPVMLLCSAISGGHSF